MYKEQLKNSHKTRLISNNNCNNHSRIFISRRDTIWDNFAARITPPTYLADSHIMSEPRANNLWKSLEDEIARDRKLIFIALFLTYKPLCKWSAMFISKKVKNKIVKRKIFFKVHDLILKKLSVIKYAIKMCFLQPWHSDCHNNLQ